MGTNESVGPWDADNRKYHADREYLSHSRLELFIESRPKYKRWFDGDWEQTESNSMMLGTAVHLRQSKPESFDDCYEVVECSTRNTNIYKKWAEDNPGKVGLLKVDLRRIDGMCRSIENEPMAVELLASGQKEQAYRFVDGPTGIKCKLMCDLFDVGIIADIKTSKNPEEDSWSRDAALYGYHRQAAFYVRGLRALGLVTKPAYLFIVVGNEEPFDCHVRQLDEEAIELGAMQIGEALAEFALCKVTGNWQHKSHGKVTKISLPAWYMRKEGF